MLHTAPYMEKQAWDLIDDLSYCVLLVFLDRELVEYGESLKKATSSTRSALG
jgi:hypothetical protein